MTYYWCSPCLITVPRYRKGQWVGDHETKKTQPKSVTSSGHFGGRCQSSTKQMMHGHKAVNSHLSLLLMVGRRVCRPDIKIRTKDGCQARVFPHLTRPKFQPTNQQSATSGRCWSTNHMMHGHKAMNSHLSLMVMIGRCLHRPDIRIGDQDGHQARMFPHLTRPKSQPKSANKGGASPQTT